MDLIITVDDKDGNVKKVVSHITQVGIKPDVVKLIKELRSTLTKVSLEEFASIHLCEVSSILNNDMIDRLFNEAYTLAQTKGEVQ